MNNMGGYWGWDRWRHVVCPNPECDNVYWSRVVKSMCSKCKTRFLCDDNQYKTIDGIVQDRKKLYDELGDLKTKFKEVIEKMDKMQRQLKPFNVNIKKTIPNRTPKNTPDSIKNA